MKLNWLGYWERGDGYGRFNTRMVQALQRAGVKVRALHVSELARPDWLLAQLDMDWSRLTITCAPPFALHPVPQDTGGRHWLYTMTEGGELPDGWAERIADAHIERVIVPCAHNAEVFRAGGVDVPVHVVQGGTDPHEFPALDPNREPHQPYTFFALADRNDRKGWHEVFEAFYKAFGGKTTGDQDVRLVVKCRPGGNPTVDVLKRTIDADPRIEYRIDDVDDMAAVYAEMDCICLPSRSEGWGMPHREAAMMGLPVITQAYSGLDDGHTHEWALVVKGGRMARISNSETVSRGPWRVVDIDELAQWMRRCYERPYLAQRFGERAAQWLRRHQTWDHAASALIDLIRQVDSVEAPRVAAGGY